MVGGGGIVMTSDINYLKLDQTSQAKGMASHKTTAH